jgi:threonine aldolase
MLLTVLEDDEEEKKHDHMNQLAEELAEIVPPTTTKESPAVDSTNKFCRLEKGTMLTTKQLGLKLGNGNDDVIN